MAARIGKDSKASSLEEKDTGQVSFLETLDREPETDPTEPKIWTITELSKSLRDSLRNQYQKIWVRGEICDFKGVHRSGHLYMGLKDESAQLRVVAWKATVQKIPFDLKLGLEVIILGCIDYYGAGASLQLVAEKIEPLGMGALQLKFEQLKEKLQAEGLFALERKKEIPNYPNAVGLVTGRSTAALQDMLRLFAQRYPLLEIFLFHCSVQGDQAPAEIVAAIARAERFSRENKKLDVLVVGRGGGSYEDLFCFNDESLVRKIAACSLPTISAVGHEIDFTLCDFAADRRAATPSHAVQECTPDLRRVSLELKQFKSSLTEAASNQIRDLSQKLDLLWNQILSRAPHEKLKLQKLILEQISSRLQHSIQTCLDRRKSALQRYSETLDALSPLKILERGYSLVRSATGKVLRQASAVKSGDQIDIKLFEGEISAQVVSTKKSP